MDIVWENPPPAQRGPSATTEEELKLAAVLLDNPDQWAVLKDFDVSDKGKATNLAALIRRGNRRAFRVPEGRDGEFQASARRVPDTTLTRVYVRYASVPDAD